MTQATDTDNQIRLFNAILRLDEKLDRVESRLERRIDQIELRLERRFDQIDQRLDRMDSHLNSIHDFLERLALRGIGFGAPAESHTGDSADED